MTDVPAAGVTAVPTTPAAPIQAAPVTAAAVGVPLAPTPGAEGASVQVAPTPGVIAGDTQPAPVEAPVIVGDAPAQPAEGVPVEAAPEPAEAVIVGEEPAPAVEAPVEAAPTPTPEPIKYTDWELPENVALPTEQASALGNIFGKYGLTQEATQEIVTYGSNLIKQAQEQLTQAQHDVFAQSRAAQRKEFEKQAGNRRETVLSDAKAGLALAVPNAKARAALLDVLGATGAGDNTHVIHAFATIGKQSRERSAPGPSISTPKPSSAPERRYGKSK